MQKSSDEYIGFLDALLCIAEHTCGMDSKMYFADYEHYLKKDFQKARKNDKVTVHHPLRDFPHNFLTLINRRSGNYKQGSYQSIEKSWQEQRNYINLALSSLNEEHKAEAEKALLKLMPALPAELPNGDNFCKTITCGDWKFELNEKGGIGYLAFGEDTIIRRNNESVIDYYSFSNDDYKYWLSHYSRNLKKTAVWAVGDFARPLLKYVNGKYPTGCFAYFVDKINCIDSKKIAVNLKCDRRLCDELGAPRLIQIIYTLDENGLNIGVSWFGKDANRLTEAIYIHLFPSANNVKLKKIDDIVDPNSVVSMGGRNLHAVFDIRLKINNHCYKITNYHSPLISIGRGKILQFDNKLENAETDGITYVLYNNVWGTNFPLWYEDNAHFEFDIRIDNEGEQ